ncbi:MAG: hypothetical protein WA485_21945 [Candidatus Sulfotelmatobacter sp.]
MSIGALYIITQDPRYVGLLLTSAASLKKAMPDLPITVFSQFPVDSPLFENVTRVEPTKDGFYDKSRLIQNSPYERTLFIDADTYVLEPVPELFALLDHFDCAATHEEYVNTDWHNRYPRPDIPSSFPEFNTGILMLKRSDRLNRVLKQWENLYRKYLEEKPGQPINDQPFFRVAVYDGDVRVATLTREYNCKFRGQGYLNGRVKIIHGHVEFKLDLTFLQEAVRGLNASEKPRVYIAGRVYDQKLVGRFSDRRRANLVGTFPLHPESEFWAEAKGLKKTIQRAGMRNIVARVFAVKSPGGLGG